jgi:hypothetical protein
VAERRLAKPARRRVGAFTRVGAAAWTAVAVWRFVTALGHDQSDYGGEAQRKYIGLLMLQSLCALIAAAAVLGAGDAAMRGERRWVLLYLVLLTFVVGAFLLIFTKDGLTGFGPYEN